MAEPSNGGAWAPRVEIPASRRSRQGKTTAGLSEAIGPTPSVRTESAGRAGLAITGRQSATSESLWPSGVLASDQAAVTLATDF
jgi:hypothetical protein